LTSPFGRQLVQLLLARIEPVVWAIYDVAQGSSDLFVPCGADDEVITAFTFTVTLSRVTDVTSIVWCEVRPSPLD
jgi:hypothetical protein